MRSAVPTPFFAVFRTEVLLNSKRVAPYLMILLFFGNALLWWGWGPGVYYGWATNGEFFIVRVFAVFSFMTLPLFTAIIMGDPVIKDFRTGVAPLIFSKPVGRATYLLGKFFGNFFVLVCCQMAFALTLLFLQWFHMPGMVVQPARVIPYFKHFLLIVAISHLVLAALCFTVGALTRNVKIVYGLAVSFYPLYIAYQAGVLRGLPQRWRIALDPLLMNWPDLTAKESGGKWLSAELINQLAFSYSPEVVANRVLMVAVALLCLTILYLRFSTTERAKRNAVQGQTTLLNLTPRSEKLYQEPVLSLSAQSVQFVEARARKPFALPQVNLRTQGLRASLEQFMAALGVEFRLLRAERSLVALAPLIMFVCGLELAAYSVAPEVSYSAAYAGRTADTLLLFLVGVAIFYTGESINRDREAGIEPVLWGVPAPNFVLLISKFTATLLLSVSLAALVGLTVIGIQIYKGHTPLELQPYLTTYAVILIPSAVFMIAASVALNVLLRDKYLAYAVSLALGGGLYYLVGQGYQHPLYNPVLYQLWTPADLAGGGGRLTLILTHRIYCFALSALLLALALLFYERKSTKGFKARGRLTGRGWTILVAITSLLIAVLTGVIVDAGI